MLSFIGITSANKILGMGKHNHSSKKHKKHKHKTHKHKPRYEVTYGNLYFFTREFINEANNQKYKKLTNKKLRTCVDSKWKYASNQNNDENSFNSLIVKYKYLIKNIFWLLKPYKLTNDITIGQNRLLVSMCQYLKKPTLKIITLNKLSRKTKKVFIKSLSKTIKTNRKYLESINSNKKIKPGRLAAIKKKKKLQKILAVKHLNLYSSLITPIFRNYFKFYNLLSKEAVFKKLVKPLECAQKLGKSPLKYYKRIYSVMQYKWKQFKNLFYISLCTPKNLNYHKIAIRKLYESQRRNLKNKYSLLAKFLFNSMKALTE